MIPRITLKCALPIVNSISTIHSLLFIVFTSCGLFIFRCGLPNKAKDIASNIVDLPEPFAPTTSVDGLRARSMTVNVFPVDRKFLYFSLVNIIMQLQGPVLLLVVRALTSLAYLYLIQCLQLQCNCLGAD